MRSNIALPSYQHEKEYLDYLGGAGDIGVQQGMSMGGRKGRLGRHFYRGIKL